MTSVTRDGVTYTRLPPEGWEYKIEGNLLEEELNVLGREGWELVGMTPGRFVFKRPWTDPESLVWLGWF